MSERAFVLNPLAESDVDAAVDHYMAEVGEDTALRFIDSLHDAYAKIKDAPKLGSPRYAHELNLRDLRHVQVRRFPYLIFYIEHSDEIEVWRVLHTARDIPAWLTENDD